MRDEIEKKAVEIRLVLLGELDEVRRGVGVGSDMLADIEQRVRILNALDPYGGGFGVLSSVRSGAGAES